MLVAADLSDGYLEHVRCSSQSQILVRNSVFGGYGRALTQNDGRRTPRKLVDEDRTAVGRVRMQVGRGSRCYPIRIACIFREVKSRSSFWRCHRPTAGCARHFTHAAARACCSPTVHHPHDHTHIRSSRSRPRPRPRPRPTSTTTPGLPDRPTDRPGYVRLAGTIPTSSHAERAAAAAPIRAAAPFFWSSDSRCRPGRAEEMIHVHTFDVTYPTHNM